MEERKNEGFLQSNKEVSPLRLQIEEAENTVKILTSKLKETIFKYEVWVTQKKHEIILKIKDSEKRNCVINKKDQEISCLNMT